MGLNHFFSACLLYTWLSSSAWFLNFRPQPSNVQHNVGSGISLLRALINFLNYYISSNSLLEATSYWFKFKLIFLNEIKDTNELMNKYLKILECYLPLFDQVHPPGSQGPPLIFWYCHWSNIHLCVPCILVGLVSGCVRLWKLLLTCRCLRCLSPSERQWVWGRYR